MVTNRQRRTSTTRHETATWRVFAAVPVSDGVRALMGDIQDALIPRGWRVKWVRPELAHLTLKFYGNIETERLPELSERLARVAASGRPLRMRTTTVGAFPSASQPRVLWLGLAGDVEPLAALATQVEDASVGYGKPENRPFAPHVTLARLRDGAATPADFATAASGLHLAPVSFAIDRLRLIRSVLGPGGPAYTPIGEWPLSATPEIDDHG
ncbi:MAG TPA: RNA 2',3'-cyclic phosphodiesterase [Thermomicrobiales bacterium]|nr:RNA 2',3'-cyclic phosphodiesterase [Thermomicrobiales bacterium]